MIPDTKNIFKHEEKEKAFKKRYGKDVNISISYHTHNGKFESMNDIRAIRMMFTFKNNEYYLTEYFKEADTDYVLFEYTVGSRVIKNKYDRFLDAEVSLVDKIAEV